MRPAVGTSVGVTEMRSVARYQSKGRLMVSFSSQCAIFVEERHCCHLEFDVFYWMHTRPIYRFDRK
jgi:hypothetical protein